MNVAAAVRVAAGGSLAVRFERHRKDRSRFYALAIEQETQLTIDRRELGFLVLIERGAIGLDGREVRVTRHTIPFPTFARALECWGQRCARRRANGYEEVSL
jgi:hypothetical protein